MDKTKPTKRFTIFYKGTVLGKVEVEARTLSEAIKKADKDMPIEVTDYPTDWRIDTRNTMYQTIKENQNG